MIVPGMATQALGIPYVLHASLVPECKLNHCEALLLRREVITQDDEGDKERSSAVGDGSYALRHNER